MPSKDDIRIIYPPWPNYKPVKPINTDEKNELISGTVTKKPIQRNPCCCTIL